MAVTDALKKIFENWKTLFSKFINNDDDRTEVLNFFDEFCSYSDKFGPLFQLFVQMLCLHDIVSKNFVTSWISGKELDGHPLYQQVILL